MGPLEAVKSAWEADRESLAFRRRFREWKERFPVLADFDEVDDLVRWFQDPTHPYEEKDRVAVALCTVAQEKQEAAVTLLVFLFRPKMVKTAVERSIKGTPSHDLEAEILAAFYKAILTVTPEMQKVTRHLVYKAVDAGRANRRKELNHSKREIAVEGPFEDRPEDRADPQALFGIAGVAKNPAEILMKAVELTVISSSDADILRATYLDGFDLAPTAQVLGLTYKAAAEKRRRAVWKIVAWLRDQNPSLRNIPTRVEMASPRALSKVKGPNKEDPDKKGR